MSQRKLFPESVRPLPAEAGITPEGVTVNAVTPHPDEILNLQFALTIDPTAKASVEERVAKGETVPPQELEALYTAPAANVKKLVDWLMANGYTITHTSTDGVYAQATASQIAKTLEVNMVPVTSKGVTYLSARDVPSLPVEVGGGVTFINGLQPHLQANKHFVRYDPVGKADDAAGPAPAIANAPPYLVREILKAYNANITGVTGKGQTIAILIDTFPGDSDLQRFWTKNGVPVTLAQIQKINVSGGPLPAPSGEETLDVSWASGIAPGATVRIYATGSLAFTAIDRALDRIIADLPANPGLRQLSMSLGLGEAFMSPGEVATERAKFLRLAASGVNVFVSTGDAGSNPDSSGHSPAGPLNAEYESTDSSVIAVGGTTLRLSAAGVVSSETGWTGSGGGTSRFFNRPVWQTGLGVPHGTNRVVPDVSSAADPNTGAFLVVNGSEIGIGGTSWSAPTWAGFCALMNESRINSGKAPLTFLNPFLYPLLGTPAFRDILAGSNGAFHCGPGYDQVTGLGSPNIQELINRLP